MQLKGPPFLFLNMKKLIVFSKQKRLVLSLPHRLASLGTSAFIAGFREIKNARCISQRAFGLLGSFAIVSKQGSSRSPL